MNFPGQRAAIPQQVTDLSRGSLTALPSSTLRTTGHWQTVPSESLRPCKTLYGFVSLGRVFILSFRVLGCLHYF